MLQVDSLEFLSAHALTIYTYLPPCPCGTPCYTTCPHCCPRLQACLRMHDAAWDDSMRTCCCLAVFWRNPKTQLITARCIIAQGCHAGSNSRPLAVRQLRATQSESKGKSRQSEDCTPCLAPAVARGRQPQKGLHQRVNGCMYRLQWIDGHRPAQRVHAPRQQPRPSQPLHTGIGIDLAYRA